MNEMKKQAFNPYLPSYEYVPDGEPRVFGDRLYVFGSHDHFGGKEFCVGDYVCWSAPVDDLGNWKYEGVIYKKTQDPKNKKGKMSMNAPDVIQGPDGRFYLYYELSMLTITSVAVCDTPSGEYEFLGYVQHADKKPYGTKRGEINNFDPSVLIDDDGRIYLYTGFSPLPGYLKTILGIRGLRMDGAYCIELEKDMITMKSEPRLMLPGPELAMGTLFQGHAFFEASSMRKINGKYYFVYSSELSHELCYAVSDKPDEGFVYGGTLISIGDVGMEGHTNPVNYTGNTHGGMVEVEGQWYIFYHRQTNKQKCARQGCAEKITIMSDGSIPQVEMTSCGLSQKPLIGKGTYEARIACNLTSKNGTFPYLAVREKDKTGIHPYFTQSGEDRDENPDQYIANMTDGATAGFKYFEMESPKELTVSVRGSGNGVMEIRTEINQSPIGKIEIKADVQWGDFSTKLQELNGVYALFFMWRGNGYCDFRAFTFTN